MKQLNKSQKRIAYYDNNEGNKKSKPFILHCRKKMNHFNPMVNVLLSHRQQSTSDITITTPCIANTVKPANQIISFDSAKAPIGQNRSAL